MYLELWWKERVRGDGVEDFHMKTDQMSVVPDSKLVSGNDGKLKK